MAAELGGVRNDLNYAKAPVSEEQTTRAALAAHRIGSDLKPWQDRIDSLMSDATVIVTFRGAGSVNGIDPAAASQAVAKIRDHIINLRGMGVPVALMYDGDGDNRAKPDVGSIFGELADTFNNDSSVKFIAAQSESWFGPADKTDPIKSANGTPYETYVFANDLPGQHASLTQSSSLVAYEQYQQIFVGPAGKIAFSQLKDLSNKIVTSRPAEMGDVKVLVYSTPNNASLSDQLQAKYETELDDGKRSKIFANIEQRRDHPFGFLCSSNGEFSLDVTQYPGLKFESSSISSSENVPHAAV
jgi:hypothetical protein